MIINPKILVPTITSFTLLPFLVLLSTSSLPSWVNGESPPGGVPSLEYLGIGYNAITGNPRGTETSNIDPGFRASVIKLVKDENVLSMDTDYAIPLGTELRYITSCEYSEQSVQVSSSFSYQRQLRETATSSYYMSQNSGSSRSEGSTFNLGLEGNGVIKGVEVEAGISGERTWGESKESDFSEEVFFSSSESYQQELSINQETELSAFESHGVCAEFEAHLKKYYKHELHEAFINGLATLPVPYDKNDEVHRRRYRDFIFEYGTHYINRVTLGAKTVLTSFITKDKIKELEAKDIDISATLNFRSMKNEMSGSNDSFNAGGNVGASLPGGGPGASIEGSGGNAVVINNYSNTTVDQSFTRELSETEEKVKEITQRLETTYEFNVVGLPAVGGDWKEWARTVEEKPMPISYDFVPLWTLLKDECAAKSLFDAIVDMYKLNTAGSIQPNPDIGSGIVKSNSDPAVSYSETDIFGRYTYVSSPIPITRNGQENVSLITYNVTLQGTFKESTSPLFATMISGSIGPEGDRIDLNSIPFLEKDVVITTEKDGSRPLSLMSSELFNSTSQKQERYTMKEKPFSPFLWRSKTVGEKLSLGVLSNFDKYSDLNSFSYIAIPSLASSEKVVMGVVNPDGTPVRKKSFSQLGYSVARDGYGTWKISFDREFEEPPTLIAQPMWISSLENTPESSAQVSLAVHECTTKECTLYLGCETFYYDTNSTLEIIDDTENALINEHLGLSFLALDGNLTLSSVLHGQVALDDGANMVNTTKGWAAEKVTSVTMKHNITIDETSITMNSTQHYSFMEIKFEEEFLETPSIIITPLFNNSRTRSLPFKRLKTISNANGPIYSLEKKTFASVEYITTKKALIKIGILDTIGLGKNITNSTLFEPLPFSFLAIGPLYKNFVGVEDNTDSEDYICTSMPSISPSISMSPSSYGKGRGIKSKKSESPSPPPRQQTGASIQTSIASKIEQSMITISSLVFCLSWYATM